MMEGLEARARAAAEARVARATDRLAARAAELASVTLEAEPERVVIEGRGLWRVPELRWIGGLLR